MKAYIGKWTVEGTPGEICELFWSKQKQRQKKGVRKQGCVTRCKKGVTKTSSSYHWDEFNKLIAKMTKQTRRNAINNHKRFKRGEKKAIREALRDVPFSAGWKKQVLALAKQYGRTAPSIIAACNS